MSFLNFWFKLGLIFSFELDLVLVFRFGFGFELAFDHDLVLSFGLVLVRIQPPATFLVAELRKGTFILAIIHRCLLI